MIQTKGAVNVLNLVEVLGVSAETIRRDLLAMEGQGKLLRVHGGAIAKREMKPFYGLQERNKEYGRQKRELAVRAAGFVKSGDIIAIDSGSTAMIFAENLLSRDLQITVVTHSMDVFNILCQEEQIKLILIGGYYMPEEKTFYGEMALEALGRIHVQKAFLCPSGISHDTGIWDYQSDLVQIQKQLMQSADEVFVLADSSKFEKKAFLKLGDMSAKYRYITDSNLPDELRVLYQEKGFKIYIGGNRD